MQSLYLLSDLSIINVVQTSNTLISTPDTTLAASHLSLYQVDAASEPSGYIPLHLACITGHVGVVGLLLSRSTELLKGTDNAGRTCLHVAAASGHYDMVQVLIGQGADLTTPDREGWTALHCAASAGFLDVVKLLVESGATSEVRQSREAGLGVMVRNVSEDNQERADVPVVRRQ